MGLIRKKNTSLIWQWYPSLWHIYPKILLFLFVIIWGLLAISPSNRDAWLLESALVFIFVPLIILTHRTFRLSNVSYTLIFLFLVLHSIGSHYTYSEMPWIDWQSLGFERNHYDRIVHFSFGLFIAYPIREMFMRIATARGFWSYYLPLDVAFSFSAMFEIIEWLAVVISNPEASSAFLGTQGDEFDPIKDMGLGALGALIAMGITALINWKFHGNRLFYQMKQSLAVKRKKPLGEVALTKLIKARNTARILNTPPHKKRKSK